MSSHLSVKLPCLENGDRLTRQEFERRYEAMPNVKKAELIGGRVYMPSPVRLLDHGRPHGQIIGWLFVYHLATPGVDLAIDSTVRLDEDNDPQPDGLLRLDPKVGGRSRIDSDSYVAGAPELIVEVAASSASYDLHDKFQSYRRNGVQEYLVWQVNDHQINWFSLQGGAYVNLEPDAAGIICSQVFPGLCLAVPNLLKGDLTTVMAELQQGLDTSDHQAFVERLRASLG